MTFHLCEQRLSSFLYIECFGVWALRWASHLAQPLKYLFFLSFVFRLIIKSEASSGLWGQAEWGVPGSKRKVVKRESLPGDWCFKETLRFLPLDLLLLFFSLWNIYLFAHVGVCTLAYVCMWAHACHSMCVVLRGQLAGVWCREAGPLDHLATAGGNVIGCW